MFCRSQGSFVSPRDRYLLRAFTLDLIQELTMLGLYVCVCMTRNLFS